MFVSQIDLAELCATNASAVQAYGLPNSGAMLMFIGYPGDAPRVITLSSLDMSDAQTIAPPQDMASIREFNFWEPHHTPATSLTYWPIKFVAFDQFIAGVPNTSPPLPTQELENWFTTNALGLFEATELQIRLKNALKNATRYLVANGQARPDEKASTARRRKISYILQSQAPPLLQELEMFSNELSALPPSAAIDRDKLTKIAASRRALAANLKVSIRRDYEDPCKELLGCRADIWQRLAPHDKCLRSFVTAAELSAEYHAFAEAEITSWRGHYLFGPSRIGEIGEMRSENNVITIFGDSILGSKSEHEAGFAICARKGKDDIRLGDSGYVLDWHTNC